MRINNFNTYFFLAVFLIVLFFSYKMIAPFLGALFIAIVAAVLFRPMYEWFCKSFGGRKKWASFVSTLIIFLVIVVPVLTVVGLVANESVNFVENLTTEGTGEYETMILVINKFKEIPYIQEVIENPQDFFSEDDIKSSATSFGQGFLGIITKTLKGIFSTTIWIFVMLFSLFYIFVDGKTLAKKIMHLSPLADTEEVKIYEKFSSMTRATLKGTLIVGLVQGLIGGLTFLIAGVSSPLIWTVLMIVLSVIPAVGPALIMVPAGIIMLVLGNTWQGILILVMTVVVSVLDNFLRPRLVGSDTQMHTLIIFFATVGGLAVFGLIGFILGPIIAALLLSLIDMYSTGFKKDLNSYNKG